MSEGDGILIETILKLEEDCLNAEEDEREDRENSPKRQVFMPDINRKCQKSKYWSLKANHYSYLQDFEIQPIIRL